MLPLSLTQQVDDLMRRTGSSADSLACWSGMSAARISQGLRGVREFRNDDALRLLDVLTRVERLVKTFAPIPISLNGNPRIVKQLLDEMELTSDLPTFADLVLLNSILQGVSPQEIANNRELSNEELKETIEEMQNKFEQAILRLGAIVSETFGSIAAQQ